MESIYIGKTKDVYKMEDGNYLLQYKDEATGKDGVFDPGENKVGLTIEGLGKNCVKLTQHLFKILIEKGIPTHYIDSDAEKSTMIVKPAKLFGKGLEFICRYKAVGSFYKRFGEYVKEGQPLDAIIEITLKDDLRCDPIISEDIIYALDLMTKEQYRECYELTKKTAKIIKEYFEQYGMELYDIKFEFGLVDGKVTLIDELSGGNMRVYKNGEWILPMELTKIITG